jgi:hypothetical protein
VGEGLTPEEVLALGREVGIPGRYLQQAILEQSTALAPAGQSGLLARVVGPAILSAQRVVVGEPEDAARALISWMDSNELMVVQRQQPGRVTFEQMGGMQAALRRGTAALSSSKPRFMLGRATLVAATFNKLETGYCHVTLTAELREARRGYLGGAATLGTAGVLGTVALAAMTPFVLVAAAPVVIGSIAGWAALKGFRPVAERTLLGLERALDYLERGGIKPGHQLPPKGGLLEAIAGEIRKAVTGNRNQ